MIDANMPQNLSGRQLERLNTAEVDRRLNLFHSSKTWEVIAFEADQISSSGLSYSSTGLVANLILFNNSELPMNALENSTSVHAGFIEAVDMLRHQNRLFTGGRVDVEPVLRMISRLEVMQAAFNECVDMSVPTVDLPFLRLRLPITDEEQRWLKWQLDWFDKAIWSVSASDDVLAPLYDKTENPDVQQEWTSTCISLLLHRAQRVTEAQPDLAAISPAGSSCAVRRRLWSRNGPALVSLCAVKLDACKSGSDQIRFLTDPSTVELYCSGEVRHRQLTKWGSQRLGEEILVDDDTFKLLAVAVILAKDEAEVGIVFFTFIIHLACRSILICELVRIMQHLHPWFLYLHSDLAVPIYM
jgi:hypothetical protein